jgi:hypothetical protein
VVDLDGGRAKAIQRLQALQGVPQGGLGDGGQG